MMRTDIFSPLWFLTPAIPVAFLATLGAFNRKKWCSDPHYNENDQHSFEESVNCEHII